MTPTWLDSVTDIIFNSNFMVLATASNEGRPWSTPVVFACDATLRFYWVSSPEARHSGNVQTNPDGALVVFDSTQVPGQVQALYVEGSVETLTGRELADGCKTFYTWRYPDPQVLAKRMRGPEEFGVESLRRMYRLSPSATFALDPAGHPEHGALLDWRVPVELMQSFASRFASRMKS